MHVQPKDRWHRKGWPAEETITVTAPSDKGQYGQREEDAWAVVRDQTGRACRITTRTLVAKYTLVERDGKPVSTTTEETP